VLRLNLDVQWQSGRVVRVRLRSLPLVARRGEEAQRLGAKPLDADDVASLTTFQHFLTAVTRTAPNAAGVDVVGFEPEVAKVLDLLEIEVPPPDVISVALPQR
jgi:hypothetical protein